MAEQDTRTQLVVTVVLLVLLLALVLAIANLIGAINISPPVSSPSGLGTWRWPA